MPRLPQPGGDDGDWGRILNDYLAVSHTPTGALSPASVGSANLAPNSVTAAALADGAVSKAKLGTDVRTVLDGSITTSKVGQANGVASLGSDGKVPSSQLPPGNGGSVPEASATTSGTITLAGDLGGSASAPVVAKLKGVTISGTPTAGQVLTASSATAAAWMNGGGGGNVSGGVVWNSAAEPTAAQGAKDGDLWVDTASDTVNVILKARINGAWVTVGSAPKPAGNPNPDPDPNPNPDPNAPAAPTNVVAVAGDSEATVSFSLVSGATGYTVTASTGQTAMGTTSPITVIGLTNGTAVTFTVKASNASGTGSASAASAAVTPAVGGNPNPDPDPDPNPNPNAPAAPLNVVAVAGDQQATVSFDTVTGATGYTVTSSPDGVMADGTSSPITVIGLQNGTSYTFTVKASNAGGTSGASAPSAAITPAVDTGGNPDPDPVTVPAAPTNVVATAGDSEASVSFDTVTGATSYTVTSSTGQTATGPEPPIIVPGLTNGTAVTFTVTATNTAGTSGASAASTPVTPSGGNPNPTPTGNDDVTALTATFATTTAALSWTAPANPTGTIQGYHVYEGTNKLTTTPVTETSYSVTGLTAGTHYRFKVTTVVNGTENTGVSVEGDTEADGGGTPGGAIFPLKVSADKRHFETAGGEPYLMVADTCWTMFTYLSNADMKRYIDIRASQGFNTIMTNVAGFDREIVGPNGPIFENADVTKPVEQYMANVDAGITYAASKGMQIMLNGIWAANAGGGAHGTMPSASDMTTFGTMVGTRFGKHDNVIFYVGGDSQAIYPDKGIDIWDELKAYITAVRSADNSKHIVTYHPGWHIYDLTNGESWLDFNSFQNNGNDSPYQYNQVAMGYGQSPTRPIFCIEPAYDPNTAVGNTPTTPILNRQNLWWTYLAGAVAISYGGPPEAWKAGKETNFVLQVDAINRTAAIETGKTGELIRKFAYQKLSPTPGVVTSGSGSAREYVGAATASDKSLILIYVPSQRTITVDLTKLGGAGTAQWYNPVTAAAVGTPTSVTNSGTRDFASPGTEDCVLALTVG